MNGTTTFVPNFPHESAAAGRSEDGEMIIMKMTIIINVQFNHSHWALQPMAN